MAVLETWNKKQFTDFILIYPLVRGDVRVIQHDLAVKAPHCCAGLTTLH